MAPDRESRRSRDRRGGSESLSQQGRDPYADPYSRPGGSPPLVVDFDGPYHRIAAPSPFHVRQAGEVRPHRLLCIARRPDSPASQQYRLLRYRLREGADPRLIGITSPRPGEGKTTVAANLGLTLAEGRRVRIMLLDLNLRQPDLAGRFGLPPSASVADQLRRKLRDAQAKWEIWELGRRLHLMGGGQGTDNPAPLLNSPELRVLLTEMAETYDYVVLDLPAVLVAADVKSVQELVDGLILVGRAGFSTRASFSAAVDQLGTHRLQGTLMLEVDNRYLST